MARRVHRLRVRQEGDILAFELRSTPGSTRPYRHKKKPFKEAQARELSTHIFLTLKRLRSRDDTYQLALSHLESCCWDLFEYVVPKPLAGKLRGETHQPYLVLELNPDLFWLPWELLYDKSQFLCQRFCVSRQPVLDDERLGEAHEEQLERERHKKALIVLGDVGGLDYEGQADDVRVIIDSQDSSYSPVLLPGRKKLDIRTSLKLGPTIYHFIGHGQYKEGNPAETGWKCGDGGVLSCEDLEQISSDATFPFLIFANACESAPPSFLAEEYVADLCCAFLARGVPHYIGTLTRIEDALSRRFASAFYATLMDGATIGEALWNARQEFLTRPGKPIWAYYVHYGEPNRALPEQGVKGWYRPRGEVALKTDYLLEEYRSRVLAGRDEALVALDRFVSERRSGILVLTAKAGVGKTALLAHWTAAQRRKGRVIASHFFQYEDDVLRDVERAHRHLLAQVASACEVPEESVALSDPRDAIFDLIWNHGAPGGDPLILVIDGLDAAVGTFMTPPQREPVEGVFVIVSGKADDGEEPTYLRGWTPKAERLHLRHLSHPAIAQWLASAGDGTLAALAEDEALPRELEAKTLGLPLCLRYVIEHMVEAAKRGEDILRLLRSIPQGLSAYVTEQWRLLEQRQGHEVQALFALLSITVGHLSEEDVQRLTGVTREHLRNLPSEVSRWLAIRRADPTRFRCTFTHPLLASAFAEALGPLAKEAEAKLLRYCAKWKDHWSYYAFRHHADHLRKARAYEALFALARDEAFRESQRTLLPDEPDLPLRTVETALETAAHLDRGASVAELLLLHAQLAQRIREESPLEALETGFLQRAWTMADLYGPAQRVLWYLFLAWELNRQGRIGESRAILERLLTKLLPRLSGIEGRCAAFLLTHTFEISERAFSTLCEQIIDDGGRCALAEEFAACGDFGKAIEVANEIGDEWIRDDALGTFALQKPRLARTWNIDHAHDTALEFRVLERAKARDFDGAIQVAGQIKAGWRRAETIAEVAKLQAKSAGTKAAQKTFLMAIQVAREIEYEEGGEDKGSQVAALSMISRAQAEAGEKEAAMHTAAESLEVADTIEDEDGRACALAFIGKAQAIVLDKQAADRTFALAVALARNSNEDEGERASALAFIGEAQAIVLDKQAADRTFALAVALARNSKAEFKRESALQEIADAQAKVGDLFGAHRTAEELRDPYRRATALCRLAEIEASSGQEDRARSTLAAALNAADEMGGWSGAYPDTVISIARVQLRVGQTEAASQTFVRALQNADANWTVLIQWDNAFEAKAATLEYLAEVQVRAGYMKAAQKSLAAATQAAKAMNEFLPWEGRDLLLEKLAITQARLKGWDGALRAAEAMYGTWIEDGAPDTRTYALRVIAEGQADEGDFLSARETIGEIRQTSERTEALQRVAEKEAGIHSESQRSLELRRSRKAEADRREAAEHQAMEEDHLLEGRTTAQTSVLLTDVAETQLHADDKEGALRSLAHALGKLRGEQDEAARAFVLGKIALLQAKVGMGEEAVRTAQAILKEQNEHLPRIAEALVSNGDRKQWKRLLSLCAFDLAGAYRMCRVLARIYPGEIDAVAEVIAGFHQRTQAGPRGEPRRVVGH